MTGYSIYLDQVKYSLKETKFLQIKKSLIWLICGRVIFKKIKKIFVEKKYDINL